MIKPASYWALHKTCDPYTLGRVAATLGGQTVDPPLSPAERALVAVIQQDSEWMDERIDRERERQKERKRAYRERAEAEKAADGAEKGVCPSLSPNVPETKGDKAGQRGRNACPHLSQGQSETRRDKASGTLVPHPPSIPPSLPPSVRPSLPPLKKCESVCLTRTRAREGGGENVDNPVDNSPNPSTPPQTPPQTRMDVPTEDAVAEIASTAMGVGADYARWWHREMTARGWTNTDGTRVHNGNWRPTLKSWRNRASGDELAEAREYASQLARKRQRAEKPPIWTLCAERCANCGENGCQKGRKTPPEELEPPIPPQECPDFKAKGGENGKGGAE